MSGHYCKGCNYKLTDKEEDQMLDNKMPFCKSCGIAFSPDKKEKADVKE